MKILVDMNLSPGWAGFLTGNGIESVLLDMTESVLLC